MARRDSMTAFGQLAEAIALVSQGKPGHIVDTLIAERGQRIVKNPLWPVMRLTPHCASSWRPRAPSSFAS